MSYTPTNWSAGDTITAAKLNKIEQGISAAESSGGGLMVSVDPATNRLNKTAAEIADAMSSGPVFLYQNGTLNDSELFLYSGWLVYFAYNNIEEELPGSVMFGVLGCNGYTDPSISMQTFNYDTMNEYPYRVLNQS